MWFVPPSVFTNNIITIMVSSGHWTAILIKPRIEIKRFWQSRALINRVVPVPIKTDNGTMLILNLNLWLNISNNKVPKRGHRYTQALLKISDSPHLALLLETNINY